VTVEAPSAPQAPAVPQVQVEPVAVPEPQALPQEPVPSDDEVAEQSAPSMPIAAAPAPAWLRQPNRCAAPVAKPARRRRSRLLRLRPSLTPRKAGSMPMVCRSAGRCNWPACRAVRRGIAAENPAQPRLQRLHPFADGKNRVFVGPLIERAEADRLRDVLSRQQNLKGFVVRFQPERG
jgi:DedD protein